MNKLLFFLVMILITGIAWANENLAQEICGSGAKTSKLLEDWHKNLEGRTCAKAECSDEEMTYTRKKCISQRNDGISENLVMVSFDEVRKKPGSLSFNSYGENYTIAKGDQCFEACIPEKKLFRTVSGLKRNTCLECFKNRAKPPSDDGSVIYPEIGKPLYPGTKCHYLCKDKEGPIQLERILSLECQKCVGLGGHSAESFQYLRSLNGKCFEVDSTMKLFRAPQLMCQNNKNLILTKLQRSQSALQWLMGTKGVCLEIDRKTGGTIFTEEADSSECDEKDQRVNDSDRTSGRIKDTDTGQSSTTPKGSSPQ